MIDHLFGQIDLHRLFDPQAARGLMSNLELQATYTATDSNVACAIIGSPHFDDASRLSGSANPAARLLDAWRLKGTEALAGMRDSYAVAIADAERRSVLLAVDRFSTKTLCYCLEGDRLSFSDRADRINGRSNDLDPQAIFDYLFFHVIPAPRTIFKNVRRLRAAHAVLIDENGAREFRHWKQSFDEAHRQPFDDAKNSFRQLIREAVATEAAGHQHVGAFLSGGTDSSTVAGMLGLVTDSAAAAYSIGFEADGYDEMRYARIAARHFGCEHHEYYVTPADLVASIPAVAQYHDQPFGNSSALPAYYCAKMAKADGCTKLLAGDGGDELFGGNSRYATQRVFAYYQTVPHAVRKFIEPMCGDTSPLRRIPGFRQATGYVRHSRIPMPDRMQSFNLIMQLDPQVVLTPDLLAEIDLAEPTRHMRESWDECEARSLINRMLAYDWRYTLADSDLPKVRGATSMAGLEVGYPLLSDRLADFSLSLAPEWKLRGFKLRWFFKEALRGFLPDEILVKKKQGFGLPFGVWTTRTPALKQLAQESLHALAERGIVRSEFIERLFSEYLPNHPAYYGEMVWILMMLEQWIQGNESARATLRHPIKDAQPA